jgi:hypothetical protein
MAVLSTPDTNALSSRYWEVFVQGEYRRDMTEDQALAAKVPMWLGLALLFEIIISRARENVKASTGPGYAQVAIHT